MPLSLSQLFSQLFTVVSRGRTNATLHPLTKLGCMVGIELRSPEYQPRVVSTWRLWSIHVGLGLIWVIRIHVILRRCHRYCDPSLFLKFASRLIDDRRVITTDNVRRVDHESSRRFLTRHDLDWQCRSWLSWLSCMPAGFCGLNPIRAGSCKKFGGQLGKVPNNLRQEAIQMLVVPDFIWFINYMKCYLGWDLNYLFLWSRPP